MKTIRDIDVKDKIILVRADFNVPIKNGEVISDLRIRAELPTLEYLRDHGAKKIIIISHLGRPTSKDDNYSLRPVAEVLKNLTDNVDFIPEISGPAVKSAVEQLPTGHILLLENLRFHSGETENSSEFIHDIVKTTGAEIYVQDGFSVSHRAHASTVAIANHLPIYAGLLLEHEISNLNSAIKNPARPLLAVIGGSKISDKEPLINEFLPIADQIFVGGKIAADGFQSTNSKIHVANDFDEDSTGAKLDIGPMSTVALANLITDAKTIIWNGLLGRAEDPAYSTASTIAAEMLGEKDNAITIICGGDTTGFVEELMAAHENLKYSLISTGGGATLEYLLGHELPGLSTIAK